MSWKSTSLMEEKLKFIRIWQSGEYTVKALCESFGISRTTGHRLIRRYKAEGESCLEPGLKRPKNIPHKTSEFVESSILKLRKKHPNWGGRKIQKLLEQEFRLEEIPSAVTINNILASNGLIKKRRRRPGKLKKANLRYEAQTCNEIWSADYKGKFRLGNKRYCFPLTIADKKSRFLFCSAGHYNPTLQAVKRQYISVFRDYGLPCYLHTDNGVPFAAPQSLCRFSKLSYWLIDHGVKPLFSDPASPQQNGKHERMHRDLKAYCTHPVASTMSAQQRLMDDFVEEYNEVRPHEALGMQTPGSVYHYSEREYKERIRPWDYDSSFKVLKVLKSGALRWGAYNWIYISTAATRRHIGLQQMENGIWKVWYRNVFLGYMDEKQINSREQYLRLYNQIG